MSDTNVGGRGGNPVPSTVLVNVDGTTIVGDGSGIRPLHAVGGGIAVVADQVTIGGDGTDGAPLHTIDGATAVAVDGTTIAGTGKTGSPLHTTSSVTSGAGGGSFGAGQDGNVTIGAGLTTLTRDMFYDTLTMQPGSILYVNGCRVFAKTAIRGTGHIHYDGNPGITGDVNTAPPGQAGAGGAQGATSNVPLQASEPGGDGTNNVGAVGGNANGTPHEFVGKKGGDGGLGGNGGGALGGAGGTFPAETPGNGGFGLFLWAANGRGSGVTAQISIAPGGGGGGGNFNGGNQGSTGGGGGAGGGWCVVATPTCDPTITISAKGGAGGSGGSQNVTPGLQAGGGGGGCGGAVVAYIGDGNFPTISVAGGAGGAGYEGGINGQPGSNGYAYLFNNS